MRKVLFVLIASILILHGGSSVSSFGHYVVPVPSAQLESIAQFVSCSTVEEIPQAECEALVALYNSTDGPNWRLSTDWLDTNTPCSWYGVQCRGGHVAYLGLFSNRLRGFIPPQLGDLTNLESLILHDNQLSGGIPPELGNLTNLIHLRLFNNQLSGPIPPQLGNLRSLAHLVLKSNRLSGPIPSELGNLNNLRVLYLSCNKLSGEVPNTLLNLVNLLSHSTDLGGNMLTTSDPEVSAFLKDNDPDWAQTQTLPPTKVYIVDVSENSVELEWKPISFTVGGGYYEVSYSTVSPKGPFTVHGKTSDKTATGYLATNLPPSPTYFFRVRTYSSSYGVRGLYVYQQSGLFSEYVRAMPDPRRHPTDWVFLPLVVRRWSQAPACDPVKEVGVEDGDPFQGFLIIDDPWRGVNNMFHTYVPTITLRFDDRAEMAYPADWDGREWSNVVVEIESPDIPHTISVNAILPDGKRLVGRDWAVQFPEAWEFVYVEGEEANLRISYDPCRGLAPAGNVEEPTWLGQLQSLPLRLLVQFRRLWKGFWQGG